ncbi:TPA: hypothetical protein F6U11_24290 [Citrobacter freundii]|nr:hypothetical protein [Citrobacter freundii]
MTKIYAKIVSHPSGNLTFMVKQVGATMWTDKIIGHISTPADNFDFVSRVSADLKSISKDGIEVIWLP